MSNIHRMIHDAQVCRIYTTGVSADELYSAWCESGRSEHYDIIVVPSDVGDALDFRLVDHGGVGGGSAELLNITLCFIGIVVAGLILVGWSMS